jgi:hypothetical protein
VDSVRHSTDGQVVVENGLQRLIRSLVQPAVLVCASLLCAGLFCASANRAGATTAPDQIYGMRIILSNDRVSFKPAHPALNTDETFVVTVLNKSSSTRWFGLARIRTPRLSPGHKATFVYHFYVPGFVRWTSAAKHGKTLTGRMRVRSAPPPTILPG